MVISSSLRPQGYPQALVFRATIITLFLLTCSLAFGQSQGLSITNYRLVSQQTIQRGLNLTYRADLVNTGTALEALTATVATSGTSNIQVLAGQNALRFIPVPANSQVTSTGTFTLQVYGNSVPPDLSRLQWTFQTAGILLPANISVTPGAVVNFPVTLGTTAPAGGVFVTLATSNPSIATVWPTTFFVGEGLTTPTRVTPSITGISGGTVTVTASAPGYATAREQLQVTSGGTNPTMSFWPGSITVDESTTQNLMLSLSTPAPAELTVNLSSSNSSVVTVPATINFAAGATNVSVPVTGVSAGSVTITASAANFAGATATVTVTQPTVGSAIDMPATAAVAAGASVNLPVALSTAAPASGVYLTLSSSNTSTATVYPSTIFIAPGMTAAQRVVPTVTGLGAGSASITASAPGYATAQTVVLVSGGGAPTPTLGFSPGSLNINGFVTQSLTLTLSAPAQSALTVTLSSSAPNVATVPGTVSFGAGATSVLVPVTGVSGGSAAITASAANAGSATATVTVTQPAAGGILLPASMTVSSGSTVNFPVTLGTASLAGGVYITLATSDPSIATVWPTTLFIAQGETSAPRVDSTVTGVNNGSATITASAFGYPTVGTTVQVNGGTTLTTMSLSPASLTIKGLATQNLTLTLSTPASAALTVNLGSSDVTVATVPATVTFAIGATSVSIPVTGVSAGSVTITASAPNIASANAHVTVTQMAGGVIVLPTGVTVGQSQSTALPVTLPTPAPAGGVTVSLVSSDPSTVAVTPSVFIAAQSTSPATPPQVTGVQVGSASITASAAGFAPGSTQVQVFYGGSIGSSFFTPVGGVTIIASASQSLTVNLSAPSSSDLVISLSSSNPSVATVPSTVTLTAGSASVNVPVTGVTPGTATITSNTPGFGVASSTVSVVSLGGVSVTWYGACWAPLTIYGVTGNFQAVDFSLVTPQPVVVNGTLFFSANCDPSQGTDNMNDSGTLTGTTHTIQGFTHFPNLIPSSAIYWIGNASTDGTKCPPGSLCSGCLGYAETTPLCSQLP